MDRELTDMHQMAKEYAPAAMPERMRERLLAAMIREEAELQADMELETELVNRYSAAAMPTSLLLRLEGQLKPAYRRRWRYHIAAAILALLLVLPLLWRSQRPGVGPAPEPMVEMRRELLPTGDAAASTRCDTFVMHGEDRSRLFIKVQERVDHQLSDEVI